MKEVFSKAALLLVAVSVFFASCKGGKEEQEGLDPAAAAKKESAKKVFVAIPSPVELSNLIKETGAKFDKSLLNSPDNFSKYSTIKSKALNLGVYAADLSYASTFDQTQESMTYMNTCRRMTDELGMSGSIDENLIKRMEANVNNRDSLSMIVSDVFMETDAYLKENERGGEAALVLCGGWIEALHISLQIAASNKDNKTILERIAEQKMVVENLSTLLSSYDPEINPEVAEIKKELEPVMAIFASVTLGGENKEVKTDAQAGKTTVEGSGNASISPEKLAELTKTVSSVRLKITAQ